MTELESQIEVEGRGPVSALLLSPDGAQVFYVLGHGAGAGMRHPFMETMAGLLAQRNIATYRYQFPYMEAGRRSPDTPRILELTVRAAIDSAIGLAGGLPIVAGGKSMGGRITSHVAAYDSPPELQGLVFLGYPLHAPRKPATKRAAHLSEIRVPMLFVQGTRDHLADLDLLRPIVAGLGDRATMHVVAGGDHSFRVLKRSGRTQEEVMNEIADSIRGWASRI
ncbi:MAG: alpha/beta hydrolase [Gemmatimonadales bacterium]